MEGIADRNTEEIKQFISSGKETQHRESETTR